jgi:hypothetical protein
MVTDYAGRIELTDPQGELGLELELPHLLLRHNIPRYRRNASGSDSFAGFALEVRSLALDELHRDSDRDGLTDIAERMLQTDPRSRDSDSDGRADAADPTPNVDPAQMGVVERGVARALHYYFTEVDPERGQLQRERLPLSTKFIVTYCEPSGAFGLDELPCGPVAFSCGGDYGICLWTKEQVQHYAAALPYFSGDSVSVSSLTPRPDHPDEVSLWIEHTCILLRQVDGEYQPYETGGRMLF